MSFNPLNQVGPIKPNIQRKLRLEEIVSPRTRTDASSSSRYEYDLRLTRREVEEMRAAMISIREEVRSVREGVKDIIQEFRNSLQEF